MDVINSLMSPTTKDNSISVGGKLVQYGPLQGWVYIKPYVVKFPYLASYTKLPYWCVSENLLLR